MNNANIKGRKRFFDIYLNNIMYSPLPGIILVLLPKCIQNSSCGKDLIESIRNCAECGNCQISDIVEICDNENIRLAVVGGGRQALEIVEETDPGIIIAVGCENELIDGIRGTINKTVWALINMRPEGPCRNTRVSLE